MILPTPPRPPPALDAEQRAALEAGHHEEVAAQLAALGRHADAAQVLEQIWAFDAAAEAWARAEAPVEALRCALETGDPARVEAALRAIESSAETADHRAASELLTRRGRHREAARIMALARPEDASPSRQAEALHRAGDRVAAARVLASTGQLREALDLLQPIEVREGHAARWALAAELRWELGDAERAVRCAQHALRLGADDPALHLRLARALAVLGHDLAAQIVLRDAGRDEGELAALPSLRGRFHVTSTLPSTLAGTAYAGYDRVTLTEVEVHLLLAEFGDAEAPTPELRAALRRFVIAAESGSAIGHPAIRPVLHADAAAGIVVLPRAEGPTLRARIHPPGMAAAPARARATVAFLLEGVAAAHARGLVHGSLLPGQIVTDALGRPQIGPFGAHHLAGLAATRTGGLEEVLGFTAPELRAGAAPSEASDIFSLGRIYASLIVGRIAPELEALPPTLRRVIADMSAPRPEDRPRAAELSAHFRAPVADPSRMVAGPRGRDAEDQGEPAPDLRAGPEAPGPAPELGIPSLRIEVAPGWSDAVLETLCALRYPRFQPILDREGRTMRLAGWTEGCKRPSPDFDWRALGPQSPLAELDALGDDPAFDALRAALQARMQPSALVRTPAGDWMLALDDLLTR